MCDRTGSIPRTHTIRVPPGRRSTVNARRPPRVHRRHASHTPRPRSAARGPLRARSTWGGRCAAPATGRAPRACAAPSARLPPRHRRRRMAAGRPRRELAARTAAATRRALGRVAARGAGSRMSAKGASCAREEPRCARTARHLTAADGGPRPAALPLVRGPLGGRRGLRFRPLRGSPPRRAPFERLFRRGES